MDYGWQHILTKEFLHQRYVVEKKPTTAIGIEVGCSNMTVREYLMKLGIPIRLRGRIRRDLTGRKFGRLTVLGAVPELELKGDKSKWRCSCECGKETVVDITSLGSGLTRSCGCILIEMVGKKSRKYNGSEYVSGTYWSGVKHGAKLRSLDFSISLADADAVWLRQHGRCALTNLDLHMPFTECEVRGGAQTASLDRIDSSKGYTPGNIQWVHKDVNRIKQNYREDYFIELCRAVVRHAENRAQPGMTPQTD